MKKAAWIVPSFIEGSGGHRTILQNAQYLVERGYQCDVYVEDSGFVKNETELLKMVERFFGKSNCNFILGYELKKIDYDIIFATAWYTAKIVRDIPKNIKKAYFIQDFEACFNPMGDGYLLACNSYYYGLYPITIGKWLSHKMSSEYGLKSQYFDFCADKSIYYPQKEQVKEHAICFIYQPDKPRRCSVLGIEALGIVKHLRPEVKIYLYGSKEKGHVWFEHDNLGIISIEECNNLYNKCKVGLCISSSNPSRIPFEMMAAGLPVVDLYMENNLYDMPDNGVMLAHHTPESIAEAIINILDNQELQETMKKYGLEYMEKKDLQDGYTQFYSAVEAIINDTIPDNNKIEISYRNNPVISDLFEFKQKYDMIPENMIVYNQRQSLIGKLKRNKYLRKSKIVRYIWAKIKS